MIDRAFLLRHRFQMTEPIDKIDIVDVFAAAVGNRLVELKTTASDAELRAGLPKDALRALFRADDKRSVPSLRRAQLICELLGMSFSLGGINTLPKHTDDERLHSLFHYPCKWGMDPNAPLTDDGPIEEIAFRHSWLKRLGVENYNALTFTIPDSAMAPTFAKQDVVLIDRGRAEVTARAIYLFTDPDQVPMVRRLEWVGESLVVSADNPATPTRIISGDDKAKIRIIGEAVWTSKTLR